ncbi:MAG: thermonuclease family protein [Actinomycetes bacterium]
MKSCLAVGVAGFLGLGACGALLSSFGDEDPGAAVPAPPSARTVEDPAPRATEDPERAEESAEPSEPSGVDKSEGPSSGATPREIRSWSLVRVVDGDTIRVERDGKEIAVRLIGIDTPETKDPSEPVMCGGEEAARYARQFFSAGKIKLTHDDSQGRRDAYDRTLAYASVAGRDYGLAAVKRGWAAQYLYDDVYDRYDEYVAAEEQARTDDKGVWGQCGAFDVPAEEPEPEPEPEAIEPDPEPEATEPEPDTDSDEVEYANCTEVREAGKAPIQRGEPGYSSKLDRDGDGTACDT